MYGQAAEPDAVKTAGSRRLRKLVSGLLCSSRFQISPSFLLWPLPPLTLFRSEKKEATKEQTALQDKRRHVTFTVEAGAGADGEIISHLKSQP